MPWILEHVLMYPGTYEIPLRTMYALNLSSGSQMLFNPPGQQPSSPTSAFARHGPSNSTATATTTTNGGPTEPTSPRQARKNSAPSVSDTAVKFRAHIMSQLAKLPTQPCSLPPAFVASFVRRCFPEDLEEVDFPQALTALDYLKDLETRRKKDLDAALRKLGYSEDEAEKEDLKKRYPGVASWISSIQKKERIAVALYSQVYLHVRQWVGYPLSIYLSIYFFFFLKRQQKKKLLLLIAAANDLYRHFSMKCFWNHLTKQTVLPCSTRFFLRPFCCQLRI